MMNNDGVNEEREEVKRLRGKGEAPWPDCPVMLCRAFGFWARRNTAGRRRKWGEGARSRETNMGEEEESVTCWAREN